MTNLVSPPLQGGTPLFRGTLAILPPGINSSYGVGEDEDGKGCFISTADLKQFKRDACICLIEQDQKGLFNWEAIFEIINYNKRRKKDKILLTLKLDFYYKTLLKQDEDGGIKAVQDAVCGFIGLNDNLVKRLEVEKYADANPRCEIQLLVYGKEAQSGSDVRK
jgi:Holliday junction resolvase RusA-like endonuclease